MYFLNSEKPFSVIYSDVCTTFPSASGRKYLALSLTPSNKLISEAGFNGRGAKEDPPAPRVTPEPIYMGPTQKSGLQQFLPRLSSRDGFSWLLTVIAQQARKKAKRDKKGELSLLLAPSSP